MHHGFHSFPGLSKISRRLAIASQFIIPQDPSTKSPDPNTVHQQSYHLSYCLGDVTDDIWYHGDYVNTVAFKFLSVTTHKGQSFSNTENGTR